MYVYHISAKINRFYMKNFRLKILHIPGFYTAKNFFYIITFSLVIYHIAAHFDTFELFHAFVRRHEHMELDEIFYVILILFIFTFIRLIIRDVKLEKEIRTRRNTEEKLRLIIDEKNLLMREFTHRVKNNFQIINSIIALKRSLNPHKELNDFFTDIINRIYSLSVMHEKMNRNENLREINLSDYISEMAERLLNSSSDEKRKINFAISPGAITIEAKKAMYCGLIFNELITNSIKHAFEGSFDGEKAINIFFEESGAMLSAVYMDTGVGLTTDITSSENKTLGFMLISNIITRQLGGTFEIHGSKNFGINFSFPL